MQYACSKLHSIHVFVCRKLTCFCTYTKFVRIHKIHILQCTQIEDDSNIEISKDYGVPVPDVRTFNIY